MSQETPSEAFDRTYVANLAAADKNFVLDPTVPWPAIRTKANPMAAPIKKKRRKGVQSNDHCSSCSPCLVLLLLPPCNVVCVGGLQPGCHAHGGRGAGSASPPYPSGALQERYARKGGGTRWWVRGRTTTSGLHACTHAPGSAPHCCGSRCTAVGSVAATCWLLASFLSFAAGGLGGGGEGGDWRLPISDIIFSRRGCGALAFASRGATSKSFAARGAHAPLCLLNFLGPSRTLGVVSRLA
eukprot:COSAG06_NODE_347_length_17007_cov_379.165306_2_plen_241_part_00